MTRVILLIACLGPIAPGPAGNPRADIGRSEPARAVPRPHETFPHDPWMPRPTTAPVASIERCEPWVRDGYTSIQVNVDPRGCNILGDAANEPSIAIDPTDPRKIVIGWRQFDTVESNFRQAGYAYSHDGGHTWVFPGVLDPGVFHTDPVLDASLEGTIYYYGFVLGTGGLTLFRSVDAGITWAGSTIWDSDKPWMVVDRTDSPGRGQLYVTWGGGSSMRSTNGGDSFEWIDAYSPRKATVDVGPDGTVFTAGEESGLVVAISANAKFADQEPVFPYPFVRLPIGNEIIYPAPPNPGGLMGQVWVATDHTDSPTRGNVYVLGSVDRSIEYELDVAFARSTDGGASFGDKVRVNDDPEGNGAWQWFGMMSVAPNGRIDAVWIDTRNYPEAEDGNLGELYYSYSTDAGDTWSTNVPVSPMFDSHVGWPYQDRKLGDYYHMRSDNLGANVAYAATFNGEQDVYFLRIGPWDCNANEIPDEADIADRTSLDANANTVPDECEYRGDADGDGLTTLRDYAAFQNCFASNLVGQTFQSVIHATRNTLRHAHPRWCIPRRSSDLTAPATGWHARPQAGHVEPRARCDPACGLSDIDSDGAVNLPDLAGLLRVLSGP